MKFTRRHLLQGASLATISALLPKNAEALLHRQGGSLIPFGKNQIGLEGLVYYDNIHPLLNWYSMGANQQLDVTCTNGIASLTAALPTSTITFTIGNPAVVNWTAHGLAAQAAVTFSGGTPPTGIVLGTTYYVSPVNLTANSFQIMASPGTSPIGCSGTQTPTITATSVWTATATTVNPHLLLAASQPDPNSLNSFWSLSVTCPGNSAYNTPASAFNVTMTGASTFSYPIVGNVNPGAGAVATYNFSLFQNGGLTTSFLPNRSNSGYGLDGNLNQFYDSDGNVQPNCVGNATSFNLGRPVSGIDAAHGAIIPPGYTRAGQQFALAYTPLGSSTPVVTRVGWPAGGDYTTLSPSNFGAPIQWTNPAAPPRNIFFGLSDNTGNPATDNYAAWLLARAGTGSYWDKIYVNTLKPAAGSIRFMDYSGVNGALGVNHYTDIPAVTNNYWAGFPSSIPPLGIGVPVAGMTDLVNQTNKHPWFCIPPFLGVDNVAIKSISKGSTTIVTTLTPHPYITGQTVILYACSGAGINVSGSPMNGYGQQASVTFTAGGVNTVNYTSHGLVNGQRVSVLSGSAPSNITTNQIYYVCNAATNTFQLASTEALALAGTAISFATAGGTATIAATINQTSFTVGATTKWTFELLYTNSLNFGAIPTGQGNGNYAQLCGIVTTPISLSRMTTELTTYFTAIKNQITNPLIIPLYEWSNEIWNAGFVTQPWIAAQQRCFVDGSGNFIFISNVSGSQIAGYIEAHCFKTLRDVYGGTPGRAKWQTTMGIFGGNPSFLSGELTGMDYYLANVLSGSLTTFDLLDFVNDRGYWGGGSFCGYNGQIQGATNPTTINYTTSAVTLNLTSPATITWANGTNNLQGNPITYPIAFYPPAGFNMPIDLATGQPLKNSAMVPAGYFTGRISSASGNTTPGVILDVQSVQFGVIQAGAEVRGAQINPFHGLPMGGIQICTILPFGTNDPTTGLPTTGTGGAGTYVVTVSQLFQGATAGSYTAMTCQDYKTGNYCYYLRSNGNNATFSATPNGPLINLDPASPAQVPITFTADISNGAGGSGQLMTVTGPSGTVQLGMLVQGTGIFANQRIVSQQSGTPGGAGVYLVSVVNSVVTGVSATGTPTLALLSGQSSQLARWMGESIDRNIADPVTYPSRYSYFNSSLNGELLTGATTGFNVNTGQQNVWKQEIDVLFNHVPTLLPATGPSVGFTIYEGDWGNNFTGASSYTPAFDQALGNPLFQEFWPQAINTIEHGALWTSYFNAFYAMPSYAGSTVAYPQLKMGRPSKFVDGINPNWTFAFGALSVIDHWVGIGSPNWQNPLTGTNGGGLWNAILASN